MLAAVLAVISHNKISSSFSWFPNCWLPALRILNARHYPNINDKLMAYIYCTGTAFSVSEPHFQQIICSLLAKFPLIFLYRNVFKNIWKSAKFCQCCFEAFRRMDWHFLSNYKYPHWFDIQKSSLHIKLMMFKHLHFAFVGANIAIFIVQAAF